MDISIFEIIGPVMIGPSSSGTAGMARLGLAAHRFLTGPLKSIDLKFHPRNNAYVGLRSHLALIGGAMGIAEYDPRLREAMDIARDAGIEITRSVFDPAPKNGLTVKLSMVEQSGKHCDITGISVGGGSIAITGINEFEVELLSTERYLFVWSDKNINDEICEIIGSKKLITVEKNGKFLTYGGISKTAGARETERIKQINGVTRVLLNEPFLSFGYVAHEPLFKTYDDLLALSEKTGKDIAQLAIDYEINRSGRSREDIIGQMKQQLDYMRDTVHRGLNDEVKTIFGFGSGTDGKRLMEAYRQGKTLGGSTLPRAIAKALATMEMDCSMNRVVAAPTAGSCGIVPGCLLTVQEDRGYSDNQLVEALFVAAAMGVVMYYHNASFSGMGGGCQAEIGVSSAIAAGALVYLAGGNAKQIVHGMALSMKNILGLICDRIGGSSEVPCIRRNGIGVANAFSGADMAIAGIESYVPPDEVIEALCNTQKLLPPELRGGFGGLGCTKTSKLAREIEKRINASIDI